MNGISTLEKWLQAGLVAVLVGFAPACRDSREPADADAAGESAKSPAAAAAPSSADGSTASPASPTPDSGLAPARRLAPTVRAVAGTEARPLAVAGPNEDLEPQSRFELELPPMSEVRVRLFDASDKAVPSTDRMETGAVTRYVLTPTAALAPASRYALVIDGLRAPESTDQAGNRYEPLRIELKTGGEPVRQPPAKSSKKRRR